MNPLVLSLTRVIYHGDNCADGKCASWVIWRSRYDDYQSGLLPMDGIVHNQSPPNVTGDIVAILDFCFPRKIIESMAKQAKRIYILDHHETAKNDLDVSNGQLPDNVVTIFDMKRSGAEITWDWAYPNIPRPWFLEIIGDRDLFRWTHAYSWKVTQQGLRLLQILLPLLGP